MHRKLFSVGPNQGSLQDLISGSLPSDSNSFNVYNLNLINIHISKFKLAMGALALLQQNLVLNAVSKYSIRYYQITKIILRNLKIMTITIEILFTFSYFLVKQITEYHTELSVLTVQTEITMNQASRLCDLATCFYLSFYQIWRLLMCTKTEELVTWKSCVLNVVVYLVIQINSRACPSTLCFIFLIEALYWYYEPTTKE